MEVCHVNITNHNSQGFGVSMAVAIEINLITMVATALNVSFEQAQAILAKALA